jgi:hypothetical protein
MEWLMGRDDIEIRLRGRGFYEALRDEIFVCLPDDLAASLVRRCRYLAQAAIDAEQPLLFVGDDGWTTSR